MGRKVDKTVGESVRRARSELGLSQGEAADQMGVSQSFLCDVESGRRKLPWARREDFERVLLTKLPYDQGCPMQRRIEELEIMLRRVCGGGWG